MLLILAFFTILLLFSVTWLALFLAKQVTVPIQALTEGTREVSAGNFDHQVPEQAQDELGVLVRSFNAMTTQLRDNRSQIDQFTRNLQQAVQELERRRQLMETVLENIPTGVISLDAKGVILRVNSSVSRMFGITGSEFYSLEGLVGADAARIVNYLMRRSLRIGEVSTLAELVNEFSQFVRFPTAKLVPTNANTIVHQAVEVFSGRLDGITLKTTLADNLPQVRADGGLLRSVIVNLIDNAAEALENSSSGEILVSTVAHSDAETVVICVSDTGTGISPEDKDKLFLPHFSTKDRGTGLGLAIAARIVAEHGGSIHVEDNLPMGSRFLVELPVAELTTASLADHNGSDAAR